MQTNAKIGLGGLLLIGSAVSAQTTREFSSRYEAMGYHGAKLAFLVAGLWLLIAGLLQRRRERSSTGAKPPPKLRTPLPPRAVALNAPKTREPSSAPASTAVTPTSPDEGPRILR
jgi:hypothetical protein